MKFFIDYYETTYQTYGHKMDGDAELVASMIGERYDEIFSSKKNGTP